MAAGIDAAASICGIFSIAFETFNGCVKAYQVFYRAQNIGNEGEFFRSRLQWEQFRTEDWARRARIDGEPLETLHWLMALGLLRELKEILTRTEMLKSKYSLSVEEDVVSSQVSPLCRRKKRPKLGTGLPPPKSQPFDAQAIQ
ncbi:MAG: hypothetical protein M1820_010546 [Bogoriella megaspora]|nr:MAG: hypothetical protein M1820_010546 [Bogoriella megaspora]